MRLQKFLAKAGVASRRKSEELILNGKIKVNNIVVTKLGTKVNMENDIIHFEDKIIKLEEEKVYIILNKPKEYISSAQDQFNRKTVLDLITNVQERVYPIGRLDYDTSGLLLLTNDGDLTYKLSHPKNKVSKKYKALVKGTPTKDELKNFESGLHIEDYITSTAKVKILKIFNEDALLDISIHEGKNRQVRKMCLAIGHEIINLERYGIENLELGDLKLGSFRFLNDDEISYLKNL